jgi:hypothetical protein
LSPNRSAPPSLGLSPNRSAPPRLNAFADASRRFRFLFFPL